MMPSTSRWFLQIGFQVWQVPGVSRAWHYEFANGSYVLVTDPGGYDLPELGGPYAAIALSLADEVIGHQERLRSTRQLVYWLRHIIRLCAFRRDQTTSNGPLWSRASRHLDTESGMLANS
jgi:hypothetical protein